MRDLHKSVDDTAQFPTRIIAVTLKYTWSLALWAKHEAKATYHDKKGYHTLFNHGRLKASKNESFDALSLRSWKVAESRRAKKRWHTYRTPLEGLCMSPIIRPLSSPSIEVCTAHRMKRRRTVSGIIPSTSKWKLACSPVSRKLLQATNAIWHDLFRRFPWRRVVEESQDTIAMRRLCRKADHSNRATAKCLPAHSQTPPPTLLTVPIVVRTQLSFCVEHAVVSSLVNVRLDSVKQ